MTQPAWAPTPAAVRNIAKCLSDWGALVLTEDGETLVDDLALISNWWTITRSPGGMLDLDPSSAAPGVEGFEHTSGLRLVPDESFRPSSVTGPLVRLVLDLAKVAADTDDRSNAIELEGGLILDGCTQADVLCVQRLKDTMDAVTVGRLEDFAGSASYMGSKKELLPFIFGGIEGWAPDTATFIDLMTGSGVVAGRAAMLWKTVASDAQSFARQLARAQSGGMSHRRASDLMARIRADFAKHDGLLRPTVGPLLERERDLLHSPLSSDELAPEYARFVSETPRYPDGRTEHAWDPVAEVLARQQPPHDSVIPYCLMTAYYSNVYIGVEQALQVDNLRYAIDQLDDETDHAFAMAALIVAVSQVASAYGGHFAQPWATPDRVATPKGFAATIKLRTRSVIHEFEARLYALASRSSQIQHKVEVVDGPWRDAIEAIKQSAPDKPVLLYLDAPYKRDEYSRYYHVLETLATYRYPEIRLGDRLPIRGVEGGRFASEFSTRSSSLIADRLAAVINTALTNGWRVAWSYSSDADTNIHDVMKRLSANIVRCAAISAPHRYRRQGRSSERREIREYLVLIDPGDVPT